MPLKVPGQQDNLSMKIISHKVIGEFLQITKVQLHVNYTQPLI